MENKLTTASCFLFDMDGTIYLGERLLPGALDFINYLKENQIPYYFLTNNSSRSRADYVTKLNNMGLPSPEEKIFSSGEATAIFLQKQKPGARIYLVGTPSLEREFIRFGFELTDLKPDYAVLGFDTTLTYEKLRKLCALVTAGVPYIATHPDINCPTEDGFIPDIGSIMALVSTSTGRDADIIIGKPHKPIVEAIVEKTGFQPDEIIMVGDRLYTDIALGKSGLSTVLVLSGEAKIEDLEKAPHQPDFIAENIADLHTQYLAAQKSK
ncbi:MAG: HAD-IIA family hydrolase [Anaerolineaceae bacterium]|nr:HAD-IIA family hydrolase [Anaerolineaceae bacterium]